MKTLLLLLSIVSATAAEPLPPPGWRYVEESRIARIKTDSTFSELYLQFDTKQIPQYWISAVSYNTLNLSDTNITPATNWVVIQSNQIQGFKCRIENKAGWETRLIERGSL